MGLAFLTLPYPAGAPRTVLESRWHPRALLPSKAWVRTITVPAAILGERRIPSGQEPTVRALAARIQRPGAVTIPVNTGIERRSERSRSADRLIRKPSRRAAAIPSAAPRVRDRGLLRGSIAGHRGCAGREHWGPWQRNSRGTKRARRAPRCHWMLPTNFRARIPSSLQPAPETHPTATRSPRGESLRCT